PRSIPYLSDAREANHPLSSVAASLWDARPVAVCLTISCLHRAPRCSLILNRRPCRHDHQLSMKQLILAVTACLALVSCGKRGEGSRNQTPSPDSQWVEPFFQDYTEAFRSRSRPRLLDKYCIPLTYMTNY